MSEHVYKISIRQKPTRLTVQYDQCLSALLIYVWKVSNKFSFYDNILYVIIKYILSYTKLYLINIYFIIHQITCLTNVLSRILLDWHKLKNKHKAFPCTFTHFISDISYNSNKMPDRNSFKQPDFCLRLQSIIVIVLISHYYQFDTV